MDWSVLAKIKSLRKEIEESEKTIHTIKMFQKISENEQYLQWLVDRYDQLTEIADDMDKPIELRNECLSRAKEVKIIYLEIAAALNEGAELSDRSSLKAQLLRDKFNELRNLYAVAKTEGGTEE